MMMRGDMGKRRGMQEMEERMYQPPHRYPNPKRRESRSSSSHTPSRTPSLHSRSGSRRKDLSGRKAIGRSLSRSRSSHYSHRDRERDEERKGRNKTRVREREREPERERFRDKDRPRNRERERVRDFKDKNQKRPLHSLRYYPQRKREDRRKYYSFIFYFYLEILTRGG